MTENITDVNHKLSLLTFLLLFLLFAQQSHAGIWCNITCPDDGQLVNSTEGNDPKLPNALKSEHHLVASISANTNLWIVERTTVTIDATKSILSNVKFWIWPKNYPDYGNFLKAPPYETTIVDGKLAVEGDISPSWSDTYDVWVEYNVPVEEAHCQKVFFNIQTTFRGTLDGKDAGIPPNTPNGSATCTITYSRYTDQWSVFNNTDLFVKDNYLDLGEETNWNSTCESVSILNSFYGPKSRSYNGLNPELKENNQAQRSMYGRFNTLNVLVENRGCVTNTQDATLELFWTVNKTGEPWGHDWYNFKNPQSAGFAFDNFVYYTNDNGMTDRYPAGNPITLMDLNTYETDILPINIPAGAVNPTDRATDANRTCSGGYLASVQWNPPDAKWYTQSANDFHWSNVTKTEPILCYMAVIKEVNKPENGFHVNYPKEDPIDAGIYAMENNNVATVNSYLATPMNTYKTIDPLTGNYHSNIATLFVNNPQNLPFVNVSLVTDYTDYAGWNFSDHGSVYLFLDDLLWNRWMNSGAVGLGIESAGNHVLRVIDPNQATLENINISRDEMGLIGIMFEYNGNCPPPVDYYFGWHLGTFEAAPQDQTGSPTYINTLVMSTPAVEEETEMLYSASYTGIKEPNPLFEKAEVYPNPVKDQLNLTYTLKEDSKQVKLEIFDMTGRTIKTVEYTSLTKGNQTHTIDVQNLSHGSYFIKLSEQGHFTTLKFAK